MEIAKFYDEKRELLGSNPPLYANEEFIIQLLTEVLPLYEDAAGGVPVWEETQSGVSVTNGAFDVELGSVTPFEIVFDKQYWLGVQVSPDAEMTPLFKLTSVPYAFVSEE